MTAYGGGKNSLKMLYLSYPAMCETAQLWEDWTDLVCGGVGGEGVNH